jgi:hypothetical protein
MPLEHDEYQNNELGRTGKKHLTFYGIRNVDIMATKAAIDALTEPTISEAMCRIS